MSDPPANHSKLMKLVEKFGLANAECQAELSPLRDSMITGTDVPAICGENPWENWRTRFFRKCYRVRTRETPAMSWGKQYEATAIKEFQKATGATIYKVGFLVHPNYAWLGGTFDALAIMPDGREVLVEIKCPYNRQIKHDIPTHYIGQVQLYLDIADLEVCMFVQYRPAGKRSAQKLDILEVERDRTYMETRMPILHNFYLELQHWRQTKEKLIGEAAKVIQSGWRLHKAKTIHDAAIKNAAVTRMLENSIILKNAGNLLREKQKRQKEQHQPDRPSMLNLSIPRAAMVTFEAEICWVDGSNPRPFPQREYLFFRQLCNDEIKPVTRLA